MIEKLRIKQFCCCCSTKTGSLVIGALGWMGSLLQAMTLSSQPAEQSIEQTENGLIIQEKGPNVGSILLCIFMFCLSVALVIGVYKDNRKFILPWLIIKFLECCALTIITIILFFMLFVTLINELFVVFVIIGLLSALYWYCWICVWSLYMDLGETTLTFIPEGQINQMGGQLNVQYASPYPPQYEGQFNGQYGQSIPMTQHPVPIQHQQQYSMDSYTKSPPQEMV